MVESKPQLYPFQLEGIEWIKSKKRAILCDSPGLGKTMQSILSRHHDAVNVICPATVKGNWAREVRIWSDLEPIILSGIGSFRWAHPGEVCICNPDLLQGWSDKPTNPISLIIDEAHTYRNNGSQKFANAKATFNQLAHDDQILSMTGTPLVNKLSDITNLLDVTGLLEEFGGRAALAVALGGTPGRRGSMNGCVVNDWFTGKLKEVMLRRNKEDVLDNLPEKHYEVVMIDKWSGELNVLMNDGLSSLDAYERLNGPIEPGTLPGIGELSKVRKAMAIEKTEFAKPLVQKHMDNGEQVILFSAHKHPVQEFATWLGWKHIDGSVTNRRRQLNAEEFLAGELSGMSLTLGAGSCGWNGFSSNIMIFIDLAWALSDNLQAEDRIHRIGSVHKDVWYKFITFDHSLDRRLGAICTGKKKLFDSICNPVSRT